MMLKITPLNVKDKTPAFGEYLATMAAVYRTYGIRDVTTIPNDEDVIMLAYRGIPILRLEPAEHSEEDKSQDQHSYA